MFMYSLVSAENAPLSFSTPPPISETNLYTIIAMGDDGDVGRAFQTSNAEVGADRVVLSTATDSGGCPPDGGYPNLLDVFDERWNLTTDPDSINGAATLLQGIDFSGEVALTDDNGTADLSDSVLFAGVGIHGVASDPLDNASNSKFKSSGASNSGCTGATNLILGNGAAGNIDFTQLLTDLQAWKTYLSGLSAERTIDSSDLSSFSNNEAVSGAGGLRTNYDSDDSNGDGLVIIDIDLDGDAFQVENTDWVIEGAGDKLIVFRLREGSNMEMSNVSILMGENYGDATVLDELGAVFLSYEEEGGSGDTVFNGDNVILNGIGWWDLNEVGAGGSTKTTLVYNNSQGCGQLISQKVNLQNARWSSCSINVLTTQHVEGTVYIDNDGDGIYSSTIDTALPNVTVTITDSTGTTHTVMTDANGYYSQTVPAGNTDVDVNDATLPGHLIGLTPHDPHSTGDNTDPGDVPVPSGGVGVENAGYLPPSRVEGTIYIDNDGDGIYSSTVDTALPDITVTITDSNGTTYTVMTDANGYYSQTVPAGNTDVDVDDSTLPGHLIGLTPNDPNGTGDNTDPGDTDVPLGGVGVENAGYLPPSLVEGTIYIDNDGDGIYSSTVDTALPDITVTITDSNGTTYTVMTNADGYYSQTVPAGTTHVNVDDTTLPPEVTGLTPNDPNGTGDNMDPGNTDVPPGGVGVENAGYLLPPGSITLQKWVVGGDLQSLIGSTFTMTLESASGTTTVTVTANIVVTNAIPNRLESLPLTISNLPTGTYTVTEILPPGNTNFSWEIASIDCSVGDTTVMQMYGQVVIELSDQSNSAECTYVNTITTQTAVHLHAASAGTANRPLAMLVIGVAIVVLSLSTIFVGDKWSGLRLRKIAGLRRL